MTKKAIALGTFDGLHLGHRAVLETSKEYEQTVLTFRIPPKSITNKSSELLMLPSDKEKLLLSLGAKSVVFLDFQRIKNTSAIDFLQYILEEYNPDLISCGYNFRFGKDAVGNSELIEDFCKSNNILCEIKKPVLDRGFPVCSTNIRNQIKNGEIEKANGQIYGGFGFSSKIIVGDQRGRTIGFPTANQEYPIELVLPKFGVYSSNIIIEGKTYKCISNIGIRPTFETKKVYCESYIIDFCGDVYGKTATLKPQKFIREEKKFSSLDELVGAIKNDLTKI